MSDSDEQRRVRIRNRAFALGFVVLFVYVGFIVLTALRDSSSFG